MLEYIQYIGLWILALWTLNMWALLSVLASAASFRTRVLWTVVLVALPGLGFLVWYMIGPRRRTA